jgi:GTP-sensing pleiotropic transcriptional regulator CodY
MNLVDKTDQTIEVCIAILEKQRNLMVENYRININHDQILQFLFQMTLKDQNFQHFIKLFFSTLSNPKFKLISI